MSDSILLIARDKKSIEHIARPLSSAGLTLKFCSTDALRLKSESTLIAEMADRMFNDTVVIFAAIDQGSLHETRNIQTLRRLNSYIDIVIAHQASPELFRSAMQGGVKDFLVEPISVEELKKSVQSILQNKRQRQRKMESTSARISSVINARGGAGNTFIATQLAATLADVSNHNTLLFDMDVQFSGTKNYLDVKAGQNFLEALKNIESIDDLALQGFLGHAGNRLRILSGHNDKSIPLLEEVEAANFEPLLRILCTKFQNIIIDVPRYLDLLTVSALQNSDDVFLTMTQSIDQVKDASKLIQFFRETLSISENRIHVVINRYQKKLEISTGDICKALNIKSAYTVDYDSIAASFCLSENKPLSTVASKKQITYALYQLEEIVGGTAIKERPSVLDRIFNRQSLPFIEAFE
ncbi:MAG: AAA family ATPase [Pseudomonadota bacterium]